MEPEKRLPGVMLYFDRMRPIFALLDAEERGKLVLQIMDYAEFGAEPAFVSGGRLESLWPSIRKAVDQDAATYRKKCEQRKRAAQARWEREHGGKTPENVSDLDTKRETGLEK